MMILSSRVNTPPWRLLVLCVPYLVAGYIALHTAIRHPGITGWHKAMLEDYIYGRCYKPWVKRQLVPLVVRGGKFMMPGSVEGKLKQKFLHSKTAIDLGWPAEYGPEFTLVLLIMYFSLVGFLMALRYFLLLFFEMSSALSHLLVITVGLVLPVTYRGGVGAYDFPQLMLFTTALVLLLKRGWAWFYPVYILACINKETSILIPLVFASWMGLRVLRRPYIWHLLFQMMIGVGIALVLSTVFKDNPGVDMEWHVHRNLSMPFGVLCWFRFSLLIFIIGLCLWGLSEAPAFLRRGFVVTMSVLLVATFIGGDIEELRDYYEALPFIVGMIVSLLAPGLRVSKRFFEHANADAV